MTSKRLNPWFEAKEWDYVKGLVLARDIKALDFFQVWSSRCVRMPTGVETTISLLQASRDMNNELGLSMSINRFLNHVSHIGMNTWGVSKLHEAAEKLKVPGWIVDIRHETTHGHMPSHTILRAGFEVCWSWICTNYWQNKAVTEPRPGGWRSLEAELAGMLECFMYLKVYHIWGTAHVKDIEETHEDVYSHILSLWSNILGYKLKNVGNLNNMTVKQAQGVVRAEILNLDIETEVLARVLVNEDLLVPEQSFLETLQGEEEEDNVEIPPDLVLVWKEFIEKIDERRGARLLIDNLVERIGREEVEESSKEFAAAWVVEISEGLLGHSKSLKLNKVHGTNISHLESWISEPSRLVQMMLPCFCNLAGVSKKKEAQLDLLLSAAVGEDISPNSKDAKEVYTIENLGLSIPTENADKGWKFEDGWGDQLTKTFRNQTWNSLWLPESTEWLPSKQEQDESDSEEIPDFESEKVVWPGEEEFTEPGTLSAFYRVQKKPSSSPRRKKMKKL